MADTFQCPNCGAPLDYHGNDPIIRCPYCSGSVIVPDNLRSAPAFSKKKDNFTLSGQDNMANLVEKARKLKIVRDLALKGQTDEAVRIFMETTGANHENAREAVTAMAKGMPVNLTGTFMESVTTTSQSSAAPARNAPQAVSLKVTLAYMFGIGCFITIIIFISFAGTIISTLGALLGVSAAQNPSALLTAMPSIPTVSSLVLPEASATIDSRIAIKELSFGGEGIGPGLLKDSRAITVDIQSRNIVIADYQGGRIQVFDNEGKFLNSWLVEGKKPIIQSMAADRKGNIYVAAGGKILVYDIEGNLTNTIQGTGGFNYVESVSVMLDGSLVIVSNGEEILHLAKDGKVLSKIEAAASTITGDPELSSKAAVDGLGNIYMLGTFSNSVFIYNAEGKFQNKFGSDGDEPGQFRAPYGIDVDGTGLIYVSDSKGIQIFSSDGRYIDVFKVEYFAYGLAFDNNDKLYVTTNQSKIERYSIKR